MLSKDQKRFRAKFLYDKHVYPWMSLLLDCYAIVDFSISEAIEKSNKKIACHKGCSECCKQPIPLSTIEVFGIKFFINNQLDKKYYPILKERINRGNKNCLFNVDSSCLVYSLRPISCRRYIVFSKKCEPNENATITRPDDVLNSSRDLFYEAITKTTFFYKNLNIVKLENESIFDFYIRNNVILSTVYDKLL